MTTLGVELGVGLIGSGFMGRTNAETVSKYLRHARLAAITGGSRRLRRAGVRNSR